VPLQVLQDLPRFSSSQTCSLRKTQAWHRLQLRWRIIKRRMRLCFPRIRVLSVTVHRCKRVHLRCLRLEHLIHRQRSLSLWNQRRKKKRFPHSLLENLVQWQLLRQRLTRLQRSIRSFHRTHSEAMNTMLCRMNTMLCRSTICQYILSVMAMTGELML